MPEEKLLDPSEVCLRVNVWLENKKGDVLYGEGRQQILEAVRSTGTLSAAAENLKMSYRGLWGRVRLSEKRLGFSLLESHAGRGPSSGSSLTPEGQELFELYSALREAVRKAAEDHYQLIMCDRPPE